MRATPGRPSSSFSATYIDRGPDSAGVIDLLLKGKPYGFERRLLRGNHEQSMLAFMSDPLANRAWLLQGGAETMMSYGVQPPPMNASEEEWIAAAERFSARVPQQHIDFLTGLERYVELGDYAFVHAGVAAERSLQEQTDDDLYWIRDRFIFQQPKPLLVTGWSTAIRRSTGPMPTNAGWRWIPALMPPASLTAARFEGGDVTFLPVSDRHSTHVGPALSR